MKRWTVILLIVIFLVIVLVIVLALTLGSSAGNGTLSLEPPPIDVVIVDPFEGGKWAKRAEINIRSHMTFVQAVFHVRQETDMLSRLGLARMQRFILILQSNMLLTSELDVHDLFSHDDKGYIFTQPNHVRTSNDNNNNEDSLRAVGAHESQPLSAMPVLVDKQILINMLNSNFFVEAIPKNVIFYFYPNYVLTTGKATRSTKFSYQTISTAVPFTELAQRKFVHVDPERPDVHAQVHTNIQRRSTKPHTTK